MWLGEPVGFELLKGGVNSKYLLVFRYTVTIKLVAGKLWRVANSLCGWKPLAMKKCQEII